VSCEGDRKGEGSFITSWVGGGSRLGRDRKRISFVCVVVGREQSGRRLSTRRRGEEGGLLVGPRVSLSV